jgi:hypothetical protein
VKPEMLHVVCAISNPARWQSRAKTYKAFEQHMLDSGVSLTTVECTYGDLAPEVVGNNPKVNYVHVKGNGNLLVWNKESLLNIGISRLPHNAKYIMTADADIIFRRPDWALQTLIRLQHHPVIQPWSACYDLGPNDEHIDTHHSFTRLVFDKQPIVQGPNAINGPYKFGHPGYAWAYTRQALEWTGGLIDQAALGAADHHMAMALIGRVQDSYPRNIHENYKKAMLQWQNHAMKHINKNLGYCPGTIEHMFHGAKKKRAYVERWDVLTKHQFDPMIDLKKNTYGVNELTGNKAELRLDMHRYFRSRDEDANTLG